MRRLPLIFAAMLVACAPAFAAEVIAPNAHLHVDGVPPIAASLAARIAPYAEFRPRSLASWHPRDRALLVATRVGNTTQLNRVDAPMSALTPVTDYADPVRNGLWWKSKPGTLVFVRDAGGNEQRQLYRLDAGAAEPALLTDPSRVHTPLALNPRATACWSARRTSTRPASATIRRPT